MTEIFLIGHLNCRTLEEFSLSNGLVLQFYGCWVAFLNCIADLDLHGPKMGFQVVRVKKEI